MNERKLELLLDGLFKGQVYSVMVFEPDLLNAFKTSDSFSSYIMDGTY